jgi:Tfp pilus assembly protein PilE
MKSSSGFTLIEILLALVLFAAAILGIVASRVTAMRNSVESERVFEATQLAQQKMAEMELKFQNEIDKNGVSTALGVEEGTFPEPFQDFKWKAELRESTMQMSGEDLLALLQQVGMSEEDAQVQIESQKLVLTNLNKAIRENLPELFVSVEWDQFGKTRRLPLVTHLLPKTPKIELTTVAEDGAP